MKDNNTKRKGQKGYMKGTGRKMAIEAKLKSVFPGRVITFLQKLFERLSKNVYLLNHQRERG